MNWTLQSESIEGMNEFKKKSQLHAAYKRLFSAFRIHKAPN